MKTIIAALALSVGLCAQTYTARVLPNSPSGLFERAYVDQQRNIRAVPWSNNLGSCENCYEFTFIGVQRVGTRFRGVPEVMPLIMLASQHNLFSMGRDPYWHAYIGPRLPANLPIGCTFLIQTFWWWPQNWPYNAQMWEYSQPIRVKVR